jgi:DNA polymerase sigma
MSIETKLLINEGVNMQLRVITDELYEMMWELQPTPENLSAIKEKLNRLVDKAWDDYRDNLTPSIHSTPKPYEHEAAI